VLNEHIQKFFNHHFLKKSGVFESLTIPVAKAVQR